MCYAIGVVNSLSNAGKTILANLKQTPFDLTLAAGFLNGFEFLRRCRPPLILQNRARR